MSEIRHWQDEAAKDAKEKSKVPSVDLRSLSLLASTVSLLAIILAFNLRLIEEYWVSDWLLTLGIQLLGVIITIRFIRQILLGRMIDDEKSFQEKRQKQILRSILNSSNNSVALGTLQEISSLGWLGILQDDDILLDDANWQNVSLPQVQLPQKSMQRINLKSANLTRANLVGAILSYANLEEADLRGADLHSAVLIDTNFSRANMRAVDLSSANLRGANLTHAVLDHTNIRNVFCDERTVLPDGTKWTTDTDWTRFNAIVLENEDDQVIPAVSSSHQQEISMTELMNDRHLVDPLQKENEQVIRNHGQRSFTVHYIRLSILTVASILGVANILSLDTTITNHPLFMLLVVVIVTSITSLIVLLYREQRRV